MKENFNRDVNKLRIYLIRNQSRDFILESANLLCSALTRSFNEISRNLPPVEKRKLTIIKDKKSKGKKDEYIGLGQWIGVYRECNLFSVVNGNYLTPKNLNEINNLRNRFAHDSDYNLKRDEAFFTYVTTMNILKECGCYIPQKVHKLCAVCLENWAIRLGKCDTCSKKLKILTDNIMGRKNKINQLILEIRCIFNPKLRDSYKKYMPKYLLGEPEMGDYVIPIPETKNHKRKRLEKERTYKKFDKARKEAKIKAMETVFREEFHLKIFNFIINLARKSGEAYMEGFSSKLADRWKEFIDKNQILAPFDKRQYAGKELETYLLLELSEKISEKELRDELLQKSNIIEVGGIYEAAIDFLGHLLSYFKALNEFVEIREWAFSDISEEEIETLFKMFQS